MNVVLISTYDLGHQPFGLASPAAWLEEAGANVTCLDLSVQMLKRGPIREADLVAFYLPMHTATRIATKMLPQVRELNPAAHLCCYGLYAPVNEAYLRQLGVETVLGGEYETGLLSLVARLRADGDGEQTEPRISLARQQFVPPQRAGLPPLTKYAWLELGDDERRTVGYTVTTRGCKHTCRHCPVVPVYNGRFRVVQRDVVMADIRQQVEAGAEHITFGDPDFFNGPGHVIPIVKALHEAFPHVTYDVTIKVEHLLQHRRHLPLLRDTGCLFVISAVESVDDDVLAVLDKGHTRADFIAATRLLREVGLTLSPTFVSFTPWTTLSAYINFLKLVAELDLIPHVSPIQYAIRLLIPAGSKLLELPETHRFIGPYDDAALSYPWQHPDPRMDALYEQVFNVVKSYQQQALSREAVFGSVWQAATASLPDGSVPQNGFMRDGAETAVTVPAMSEPWY